MRKIAALGAAGLVGVGVAACSTPAPPPPQADTAAPLTALAEPPAQPPNVMIEGTTLQPVNTDWLLENGRREVTAPADDFSVEDLDTTSVDLSAVRFVVDSPVVPAQLEVTTFDTIDAHGMPQGHGQTLDCTTDNACTLTTSPGNDALEITAATGGETQVLVLHLYYLVENPQATNPGEAIETNYASYAIRVT